MILRLGVTGPEVGVLHQQLLENGYSIEARELTGRLFGASTKATLEDFQARHVGPDGERLLADGISGPKTDWALDHPAGPSDRFTAAGWKADPSTVLVAVQGSVLAAVADVGRRESPDGSNKGQEIAKYFPKGAEGQPWCAYAVSHWVAQNAGGCPWGVMASAWKIRTWAKGHNAMVDPADARAGDVWLVIRAGGHGHIELIVNRYPGDQVACVGGNVGNAVRGTVRTATSATMIVRPIS